MLQEKHTVFGGEAQPRERYIDSRKRFLSSNIAEIYVQIGEIGRRQNKHLWIRTEVQERV
jgi:hypothetical protein